MGKPADIRRDISRTKPCRLCGQSVFIVHLNYRVVPAGALPYPDNLNLVSMPTSTSMVLDRDPSDDGYFVVNSDGNTTEGFVAYDPEMSIDHDEWGFVRYRGHDCPKSQEKRERAHGNRTFIDGRIVHPGRGPADHAVGVGAD